MAGSVLGIFTLYSLLVFYIGWNGWVWLETVFQFQYPGLYALIVGFIAFAYFLSRFGHRFSIFRMIGSYWMAILQYAILLLPIVNILVIMSTYGFSIPLETSIFWSGYLTIFIFFMIFAYGTFNAHSPVVRRYDIHIPKKAGPFKQLRIAMASDMHFGTLSGKAHLRRLVKGVNELNPDLILLPGDIIDDDPEPFIRKNMGEVMKQLKAPLGVFGVLGNHEYYGGKIPRFIEQMEKINIKILLDEAIEIEEGFYVIGRKDRTEKNRLKLNDLLTGLDPARPLLLMDHQPYGLDEARAHGIDLMVSGHTHRGQMAPNHLITKKMYELDWGYLKKGLLHVIVSSGFGFWGPPIRIGSRSEIVQIDIRFD
ncbi:metallophosphoesterase [Ammoniphilus sp. CFH 90114]|uniref:metallophosphoesterase n=1 Tax=Ammoniphilus sp. CFH 90114 TaxID=2493665 RepID=UPI00100DA5CC|nr:metallophosphoesterase [Ammoniphilus sp. CFH 90114]RXT08188.1 metallophosphoesterase [Ammoniphilus sp. CFH 90114]